MACSERPISPDDTIAGWRDVDVVRCVGGDAVTFLQGQLSQDIAAMTVGESGWSLLLQPQGKIEAWIRVHRLAEAELLIEVDAGWGAAVLARLSRFKLRVDCEFGAVESWRRLELRGPGALAAPVAEGVLSVSSIWPGSPGIDLIGVSFDAPSGVALDSLELERRRVLAGVPRMGSELDDSVIPAEAGPWLVDASASFTKGCYVGQELVARVESRGSNTPRRLRGVRAGVALNSGDVLVDADGKPVGTLTSTVATADGSYALAFVARSVDLPGVLAVGPERVEVFEVPVTA